MASPVGGDDGWFLKSSRAISLPAHEALTQSQDDFDSFLVEQLGRRSHDGQVIPSVGNLSTDLATTDDLILLEDLSEAVDAIPVEAPDAPQDSEAEDGVDPPDSLQTLAFMQGLLSYTRKPADMDNKMLTANGDVAYRSTTHPLVDLFAELEEVVSGPRLGELLDAAWDNNALATLRIIFNARSIHLGKGSRRTFYRAAGWLAEKHPLTLVANLRWLSRPVIQKKVPKRDKDDDVVLIDRREAEESDEIDKQGDECDAKYGLAHGYWKDLLNILLLAVNGKLDALSDPRDVLNAKNEVIAKTMKSRRAGLGRVRRSGHERRRRGNCRNGDATTKTPSKPMISKEELRAMNEVSAIKERRKKTHEERHEAATRLFNDDPFYRALHITVARLFADQIEADLCALKGQDAHAKRGISLCAKWAPSLDRQHDRQTLIASSIAERLHPRSSLSDHIVSPEADRETYLRHARDLYRRDLSALRAHLGVVERSISARAFDEIRYERVPSLAMNALAGVFFKRDRERFSAYLERVTEGKAGISGATMMPSTLVKQARAATLGAPPPSSSAETPTALMGQIKARVADGQWRTLVQRIREAGTLASSIAVCDVSGSMTGPTLPDGTCPLDSALGLSLLVAEVAQPPYAGAFITFSSSPAVERVVLTDTLSEKLRAMEAADWGMNTDFVKVFEHLILPMAVKEKLSREQMVKRVFVFSDMHFDAAQSEDSCVYTEHVFEQPRRQESSWNSSYDRIKDKFAAAGYDVPELVFWNLAGGAGGGGFGGDGIAPKPVMAEERGTSLVSGYSPAMLKVFLEDGSFQDPEEDGDGLGGEGKARKDPLRTVQRAINHEAYAMLRVLD